MPPPREELARSMEAVIHHFKLWTEGIRPPAGEAYVGVESPRGELGFYVVSDGSGDPCACTSAPRHLPTCRHCRASLKVAWLRMSSRVLPAWIRSWVRSIDDAVGRDALGHRTPGRSLS